MIQETKKRHFHPSHTAYAGKQDKAEARLDISHRPATPCGGDLWLFQAFLQGLREKPHLLHEPQTALYFKIRAS